jgi:hypothetical protein
VRSIHLRTRQWCIHNIAFGARIERMRRFSAEALSVSCNCLSWSSCSSQRARAIAAWNAVRSTDVKTPCVTRGRSHWLREITCNIARQTI